MWIALITIAAAYVLWCVLLYRVQDALLFPRQLAPPAPPQQRYRDAVVLSRAIAGGAVPAYLLLAPQAGSSQPAAVAIFCHGNAEIIDYEDDIVALYHRLGVSVLLPEYRGYGHAAGLPGQKVIGEDLTWFYDQLLARPEVDRRRIFFHGKSLGGGVACDLATVRKPAALILESTFTSVACMTWRYAAPPFLAKHPYRNEKVLPQLDLPILLMHGRDDDIVPIAHARALHRLLPKARYTEYNCKHIDFPGEDNVRAYHGQIESFLMAAGLAGAAATARESHEDQKQ